MGVNSDLIGRLMVEHNKVVMEALRINGKRSSNVLPKSVHEYTEMFLKRLKELAL